MLKKEDNKIENIAKKACEITDVSLWGVDFSANKGGILRIFIEKNDNTNVTIDDCEKTSKQLSILLDIEDPIPYKYSLEVSSPGLNRKLFNKSQYSLYHGKNIKINLYRMMGEYKRVFGILVDNDDNLCKVKLNDDQILNIPFSNIDKAYVNLIDDNTGKKGSKNKLNKILNLL